jgi:hypothetical protein
MYIDIYNMINYRVSRVTDHGDGDYRSHIDTIHHREGGVDIRSIIDKSGILNTILAEEIQSADSYTRVNQLISNCILTDYNS